MIKSRLHTFGKNTKRCPGEFSVHHISTGCWLVCLLAIWPLIIWFRCCVSSFSTVRPNLCLTNKQVIGRYFETKDPALKNFHLWVLENWCLTELLLLIWWLANGDFSNPIFGFYILISWYSTVRKSIPFSFCLYQYEIHEYLFIIFCYHYLFWCWNYPRFGQW